MSDLLAIQAEPGSALDDQTVLHGGVKQACRVADAFVEHQVQFDLLEWRGHLVFHDFHADAVSDHLVRALADCLDLAHVHADRSVELQGVPAGGGLRVAEHDADLHADLVDEDDQGIALGQKTGQLPERLAHQPGLQAHVAVAHLAIDFRLRGQRGDRVDDDDVHRAGTDQRLGDVQRLLPAIRLADPELVDVDAQLLGIGRIQGMLGIDESGDSTGLLRLGDSLQGKRRLAAGFGSVDFDDAATGIASDTQRLIQHQGTGGDASHVQDALVVPQTHQRTLSELLVDLRTRRFQSVQLGLVVGFRPFRGDWYSFFCHMNSSTSLLPFFERNRCAPVFFPAQRSVDRYWCS